MLKTIAKLEQNIKGFQIDLHCAVDCPTEVLKEAVFNIFKFIGHVEDSARIQQEKAATEGVSNTEVAAPFEAVPPETTPEV